jgi:hypothetical protein
MAVKYAIGQRGNGHIQQLYAHRRERVPQQVVDQRLGSFPAFLRKGNRRRPGKAACLPRTQTFITSRHVQQTGVCQCLKLTS